MKSRAITQPKKRWSIAVKFGTVNETQGISGAFFSQSCTARPASVNSVEQRPSVSQIDPSLRLKGLLVWLQASHTVRQN